MNCPQCGNTVESNQKFCGSCGFKLDSQQKIAPTPISQPPEPINPQYQPPTMQNIPNQQPMQHPYQPPKKKRGKGCLIFLLIIVILGAAGFIAFKKIMTLDNFTDNSSLPVTNSVVNTSSSGVEITNISFTTDPLTMSDVGTAFNSISSMTVVGNINNITDTVNIEALWLYEDEEIFTEMYQYQDGEFLEHNIETIDGSFFDIGIYSVIFYIDGVDVAYASFEVL